MTVLMVTLIFTCFKIIEGKSNILLILVDDLRPALGCYGDVNAHTPSIDNFAKKSILFNNAFAQQSLCAPSRNSFLTARRPDTLHLYDFYSYWRDAAGNFTTMPQYLKNLGYTTMSAGKVFHPGISSGYNDDGPYSWSEKPFHPFTENYKNAAVCPQKNATDLKRNLICPVQVSMMPNKTLPDIETLNEAKRFLTRYKKQQQEKPFFLAVGFQKPHIPLKFPRKYLKFHPLKKFKIANYSWPANVSNVAYNPWNDIRKREDVKALNLQFPWQKIPVKFAKKVIQSYYAAVTYVDDLVGRLLNELKVLNLTDDTVIIFTSDHGWSLGEHAEWAKYSNFDVALRVPLIISIPGVTYKLNDTNVQSTVEQNPSTNFTVNSIKANNKCSNNNLIINEVVELIDLFPTVANLVGNSIPICPSDDNFFAIYSDDGETLNACSEGLSLMPLIKSTLLCQNNTWKNLAFSQYPRPGLEPSIRPNSDEPRLKDIKIMGYTLRTDKFRYTAWIEFDQDFIEPNWTKIYAEELYDYKFDPHEYTNVVQLPQYLQQRQLLKQTLEIGWRSKL